jgi:hypothetical protein
MKEFRTRDASPASPVTTKVDDAPLKAAMRRFRFPIPTRVVVQEGRPIRVQTDRQGFTSGAIVDAAGPWRTSGNWWDTPGPGRRAVGPSGSQAVGQSGCQDFWDRDEWDVAMQDGTIYRLVVEREVGQWFLEGVID